MEIIILSSLPRNHLPAAPSGGGTLNVTASSMPTSGLIVNTGLLLALLFLFGVPPKVREASLFDLVKQASEAH